MHENYCYFSYNDMEFIENKHINLVIFSEKHIYKN